ncbi:MAG TPA: hypothetical protein PLE99_05625 [Candidatus Thiothrix moscowensis]|nr:hypothetical protein [Thiothrix sp. UBA2016]HRJ52200.1 hypothetical protein [Candidatus Thiothrix moscowensis]HRJ52223.1 hypothetical protein [Candidatus Thiothrix moscowensis]HRJ92515.1 hypothetical protein [Candidatus Thiothrix moscowensis]HRJ92538.1 hypothetical protein [Candidatus Thiothrix moscowensis]
MAKTAFRVGYRQMPVAKGLLERNSTYGNLAARHWLTSHRLARPPHT